MFALFPWIFLPRLSEQDLVDCNKANGGCGGGGISSALTWVHNHQGESVVNSHGQVVFLFCSGLEKNTDYPYHAHAGTCRHDTNKTVATLSKIRKVQSKNENDLKRAVHNRGPVEIQIKSKSIK